MPSPTVIREMDEENEAPGVHSGRITEEQRARITHNFRAAKALLDRKRPYEFTPVSEKNCYDKIERHPLKDTQINVHSSTINVYSPTSSRWSGSLGVESNSGSSTKKRSFTSSNASAHFREQTAEAISENGSMVADIITPKKEFQQHSYSDSFSSPVVDEDFDETILKEIDALCERHSTAKKAGHCSRLELSNELLAKACYESSADASSSLGSTIVEKLSEDKSVGEVTAIDSVKDGWSLKEVTQKVCMPKAYLEYIQSLNEMQKEAACCDILTPLMIVAGPGSGKTSTMVGRILTLLNKGISPTNILAMTFTIAAASEMRDRIGGVVGKAIAKELKISTFHSFCLQLCRSHAEKLGRTTEFLIYSHGQQRRAIIEAVRLAENVKKGGQNFVASELVKECGVVVGNAQSFKDKSKKWQKFVTQAKASGKTTAEFCAMGDEIGAAILGNYNDILRSCNALDYHDFISLSVKLLTDFPEVYEECQGAWKAIVVDEFQDTSSMQYRLLRILSAHNCITVIGDEDQSIFSFNGADSCGFDSFRKDFPLHREVRLNKNYRSTRCIVEAASSLIHHNVKRCQLKQEVNDNSSDCKIVVKECHNEDAQCGFVVDKILEMTSDRLATKYSFSNIAILYRRQVSGRAFQASFRSRKIPFNIHGVAFYRKKVVKAIMTMLRTSLPRCDDGPFRQAFKVLLPNEKEEKKKVIEYVDKISTIRKCSFISAACDIFGAKISGTLKRSQLMQGRKVLCTLDMISKLVQREQSISVVITSVVNVVPQKYLLDQRAVVDVEGGKLLNEDSDLRSVLQYLLDDVSDFLSTHISCAEEGSESQIDGKGCSNLLKSFVDYISAREAENFHNRRCDNENSVTLTTIHQSKGLEWDVVFIVKANDSEIPLLHEFNGAVKENGNTLEEERRLLYVAMTRGRRKLYILYIIMDSNWQLLQPSRFLKEIPSHLLEIQAELTNEELPVTAEDLSKKNVAITTDISRHDPFACAPYPIFQADCIVPNDSLEVADASNGNIFLKRFNIDDRSTVSHLFHQWAKKQAFHDPKRLLDKVGFVVDERLTLKVCKNKDVLRALKSCLKCDDAFQYAQYVVRWEQMPADKRAHLTREKQEYFQKKRIENSMGSSAATSKQIAYLQNLGCTVVPTSRLHASRLIEEYKSL